MFQIPKYRTALCIQAFKRPLNQTQGFKITKTIEDMEGDSEENEFLIILFPLLL